MIDNEESPSKQFSKAKKSPKKSKESSVVEVTKQHQLPNIHKNNSSVELLHRK